MKRVHHNALTLAESGALALADAAAQLDSADDTDKFLNALERNRKVWQTLKELAARHDWAMPSARLADYALSTASKMGRGVDDEQLNTLIDINRHVSAQLAGGNIERIRERAYFIWEDRGRPHGEDLDHWLIAEMEGLGRTPC
jgi:flagellar biosynthesis regulator FlaF